MNKANKTAGSESTSAGMRRLALNAARMEIHHALVLVSYRCEELLAGEIGKNRESVLAALVLAEETLLERLVAVGAEGHKEEADDEDET